MSAAQTSAITKTYGRIVRTELTTGELAAVMPFDIALKLRNKDELDARLIREEILSPAALERYLPTADDYARIRSWLIAQGFKITLDATTRHAIFAEGPTSQVAAVFGVKLARVATADGEFTSAVSAPSLPDDIAVAVAGIRGLQPHLIRHPLSPRKPQQWETNDYYAITPAAVAAVYQAPGDLTGTGQTIAVIGDSKFVNADLGNFWAQCGITQYYANMTTINVGSGPGSDTSDQFEITMDVEWTSGLAPGTQIRLYATTYPLASDNEAEAYTQILNDLPSNPNLHQVTESFGGFETPFDVDDGDTALPLLAAQGVTCFASSGDGGSNPDPNPTVNTYNANSPLAVNYPASDPYMTAVGGTTLEFPESLNGNPSLPEVTWSASSTGDNGTGGGISSIFNRPTWQVAAGVPAGNMRCVPDVSALADTGSGMVAFVYQGGKGHGGGGTSLSSPIWAAMCALINQARANVSQGPVGFLNPKLYQAAGTSSFTDITSGSNGAYQAGTGYDLCTGVGTPLLGNLITFLTTPQVVPSITTQPASQTVTAGSVVTFTAGASGTPAPTFQWQKDSSNIDGATGTSYTIDGVEPGYAGTYTFVATNAAGSATSNGAVLTVEVAPAVTIQPVNQTATAGSSVTFTTVAGATPTPSFQWKVSTDNDSDWNNITNNSTYGGANTAVLTVSGVTPAMNGYLYMCVIANDAGTAYSNIAALIIRVIVSDFNGDGQADLLWSNTATGDRALWFLSGTTISSFGYLAGIPPEWQIVGTADFNGDGQTDILWEDTVTGDRSIWLMNGSTISSFAYLAYVDPVWHIAAVGDFNGDGKADLLWENTATGDRAIWFLNGTGIASFGYLANIPTDWHIVGAADFNGDGQTDIIWENITTGDRSIWLMNGTSISSFFYLANVDPVWHIAMVADFNGDGQPDLLWENTVTGDRAFWLLTGTTVSSEPYLANVDPVWLIAP